MNNIDAVQTLSEAKRAPFARIQDRLADWLPKLVLTPTLLVVLVCMYGYILWTGLLSLTNSRLLPVWNFIGTGQYDRLFENDRWLAHPGQVHRAGCCDDLLGL